ncbi:MAG: Gfo/Idh/MocA family oxidoreductase [Pirellulales bacterium]|nr:Gfo/Idh/MocA family oxidoreductase [Pirellulales bacterium]
MRRKSNRRDFIKTSTMTSAGFWIAGSLHAEGNASPNERIRFACVGVSGKGESDTHDASRFGDVVAICDIDNEKLDAAAAKYPHAKKFYDWRDLLDEMSGGIDAVTISTPDHSHAVAAAAAMRLGKHAFVQKPLTHDIYEARMLGHIAREQKVATQMGNQGTANRNLRKAAQMVQAGILGPVHEVYVWTNRPIWPQGKPRPEPKPVPQHLHWNLFLGPAPRRPYGDDYHPFSWRGWWDFGTGSLGDMACHTMNMPFMALDLRDPIRVQAETTGHNRESYPSKSKITYEFAATARHPELKLHWLDANQKPPRELMQQFNKKNNAAAGEGDKKQHRGFADAGSLLVGEKGMLYSPGDYGGDYELSGVAEVSTSIETMDHFEEFVRAVKGGPAATSNFPDYASPLTETVLLGNLAIWVAHEADVPGKKIEWDAKYLTAKNAPEVAHIIRREYRPGYTL